MAAAVGTNRATLDYRTSDEAIAGRATTIENYFFHFLPLFESGLPLSVPAFMHLTWETPLLALATP